MKFRCERDELADALAKAARAATGRARPALSGVRAELRGDELELTGTDLELTIQVQAKVSGERDGSAVLPARLVSDIVRSLEPGAVVVETDPEEARISAGRSQFTVKPFAVEDFPRLPEPFAQGVTLDGAAFGEALRQVVVAASHDETRQILTGVLFTADEGGLRLVATDSYRLAVRDLAGTSLLAAGQKVVVPSRALNELVRVLPASGAMTISLGERDAAFQVGEVRLTTKLIEGEFPNYRQLIPSAYPNRVTASREGLIEALRRVKVMARDTTPVRLHLTADELRLEAVHHDQGKADDAVDARYEGAEMTVAFNAEYLAEGIDAVPGDEVVLETLDALKPAVVRSTAQPDFLYLLMPVRVP